MENKMIASWIFAVLIVIVFVVTIVMAFYASKLGSKQCFYQLSTGGNVIVADLTTNSLQLVSPSSATPQNSHWTVICNNVGSSGVNPLYIVLSIGGYLFTAGNGWQGFVKSDDLTEATAFSLIPNGTSNEFNLFSQGNNFAMSSSGLSLSPTTTPTPITFTPVLS